MNPRYFRSLSLLFLITSAGLAIAGEAGPAASNAASMSTANWLMAIPIVLVLAVAFGVRFKERRSIQAMRVTILNPEKDHSNRKYSQAAEVPLSAIVPPKSTLTSLATVGLASHLDIVSDGRRKYRHILRWLTNLFGSLRVFTYLPTIVTLWASADSSQYSLLTWVAWVMANATLTASIYEQNGRKVDNLVLVNGCNALMCLATALVICYLR